jgi:hypothetical protein
MIINQVTGREKEAFRIRQANRAAAVGRLMLGEIHHWNQFLEADMIDLESLPRRQLKSGKADVKKRLSGEIKIFCENNFRGMTLQVLSQMYEEIKAFRGIELPLTEFEQRFAPLRANVLKGNPAHLTVSISLWGLRFKIPEDELAKDIIEATDLGSSVQEQLEHFKDSSHGKNLENQRVIASLVRRKNFTARSTIMACFNLMEAYLNGLAWDFFRNTDTTLLSNRSKKLLEDTTAASIREKLQKYPEIIAGSSLWSKNDVDLENFLEIVKPFRDSLVHPSPFAVPEKFGGYDKLRLLYRIDKDTADLAVSITTKLLVRIHEHIKPNEVLPPWLEELHVKFGIKEKTIGD